MRLLFRNLLRVRAGQAWRLETGFAFRPPETIWAVRCLGSGFTLCMFQHVDPRLSDRAKRVPLGYGA